MITLILTAALEYSCAWMVCTHTGKKKQIVKCTETVTGSVEAMTEVIKREWPQRTILHTCGPQEPKPPREGK